jgi:dTDP-4-dehydrorhamnose reductase
VRILLTGAAGQVGAALRRLLGAHEVDATDRSTLDLASERSIRSRVREGRPEVIVNTAAYNAVDKADAEPQLADAVNAAAPGVLAEEAKRLGALLVHYSTDYVFDGAQRRPYTEGDAPNPLQAYGRSKLEGEARIRASGCRHVILRTSWVYAEGAANFALMILRKAAEGAPLRVATDQSSVPTWAADLAALTKAVLERAEPPLGTWHAAAAGETTRHAYAQELVRLAGFHIEVEAVTTAAFPGSAKRPVYSVLESRALARESGIRPIGHWRERLQAFLAARRASGRA